MDAQEDRRLPDFEREENAGRAEDPIFHVDSLRGGLNDGEDHALQGGQNHRGDDWGQSHRRDDEHERDAVDGADRQKRGVTARDVIGPFVSVKVHDDDRHPDDHAADVRDVEQQAHRRDGGIAHPGLERLACKVREHREVTEVVHLRGGQGRMGGRAGRARWCVSPAARPRARGRARGAACRRGTAARAAANARHGSVEGEKSRHVPPPDSLSKNCPCGP